VLERLDHLKGNQHRHGERLAVLFCDLDKFKTVNDTHGHQVGDEVLRLTAERLRGCLRTSDDLGARVGGDEMMIVLHGVRDLADAMEVAEKLRGSVAEPMPTGAGPLKVTMSVGVTLARQGENTAGIIARADDAMYQAKQTGRNQVIAIPPEESAPNC
jgi:diguanylate cyclase (GGDEF)-like protein